MSRDLHLLDVHKSVALDVQITWLYRPVRWLGRSITWLRRSITWLCRPITWHGRIGHVTTGELGHAFIMLVIIVTSLSDRYCCNLLFVLPNSSRPHWSISRLYDCLMNWLVIRVIAGSIYLIDRLIDWSGMYWISILVLQSGSVIISAGFFRLSTLTLPQLLNFRIRQPPSSLAWRHHDHCALRWTLMTSYLSWRHWFHPVVDPVWRHKKWFHIMTS